MSQSLFSILIFEDEASHLRHLKKILQQEGFELTIESHLYDVTRRFKTAPFDLSIVSLEMPDDEGEELVLWLIEHFPRRPIILVGEELAPEYEPLLAYKSVLGFFPRPLELNAMAQLLQQSESGLRGQVQRMRIPDLLKALRWSQSAVILQFQAETQQEGLLYLQKGEIVHAELYQRQASGERLLELTGSEAFHQILRFRNGIFTEQVWLEPSQYTLQIPFDSLMMEATTQQDEGLQSPSLDLHIRKTLLIDEDAMSRMLLQRTLLTEGIDCVSLRSLDEAQEWFAQDASDLLILDANLPTDPLKTFLAQIALSHPACAVLFLGRPQGIQSHPTQRRHVLPRPISPKKLQEGLFELSQVGFRGYLSRIGVLDFLQLNLSAIDERKKLHIRDLSTGVDGQIYLDQGQFIHAEFGELTGPEAFYRIAAIEKGDFFEDPSFQPPAYTLQSILPQKLMLNATQGPELEFADVGSLENASAEDGLDSFFDQFDAWQPEPGAPSRGAQFFETNSGGGLSSEA